jgi:hypothetical protein
MRTQNGGVIVLGRRQAHKAWTARENPRTLSVCDPISLSNPSGTEVITHQMTFI